MQVLFQVVQADAFLVLSPFFQQVTLLGSQVHYTDFFLLPNCYCLTTELEKLFPELNFINLRIFLSEASLYDSPYTL